MLNILTNKYYSFIDALAHQLTYQFEMSFLVHKYCLQVKHSKYNKCRYTLANAVADPGFTGGGFRTVMRATRARNFLGATPTFDIPRPQNAFRKYRGHVAT